MRDQIRKKDGVEEKPEEADAQRRKEEAADAYDTFDMRVDRPFLEKKQELCILGWYSIGSGAGNGRNWGILYPNGSKKRDRIDFSSG
jgi:hypothetical protein